jgi:RNA polymerase sigma-54 factor
MTPPALRLDNRQHPTLTPRLQHAVRLLQLSSMDFAQEVQAAMGKNPFLEVDEAEGGGSNEVDGGLNGEALNLQPAQPATAQAPTALDSDVGEPAGAEISADTDSWQQSAGSISRKNADSDISALEMVSADIGLREYLHGQINLLPLSARDHVLACTLIESLDDDGYLRLPLDELATLSGLDPAVDICEISTALKLVQSLEPSGVGARSVSECLLLQLSDIDDEDERDLARRIIEEQLDRLAQHDLAGLARALHADPAAVGRACDRIRRFDPRPGWRFGASEVQFVTPDVIVRKVRGVWVATLNQAVVPQIKLNQTYAQMFAQHRDAQHAEMAAYLQEARWTVRNVKQRFSTILTVAQAILKRQHHFLEFGPLAMKPLALKEIADEVGLHESTVSRVTNNKYMATPMGVFELKYFFSRAMATASGGTCSPTAIRGVIKDMIESETAGLPLSDAEIARRLMRQGLTVARRTVTKYRQLMKVAPVERRRKLA